MKEILTEKEEIKLPLFTDDMTIYVEIIKGSTKNPTGTNKYYSRFAGKR